MSPGSYPESFSQIGQAGAPQEVVRWVGGGCRVGGDRLNLVISRS